MAAPARTGAAMTTFATNTLDLRAIARALGGEVSGQRVLAPGPQHSPKDRSLCISLAPATPSGFLTSDPGPPSDAHRFSPLLDKPLALVSL